MSFSNSIFFSGETNPISNIPTNIGIDAKATIKFSGINGNWIGIFTIILIEKIKHTIKKRPNLAILGLARAKSYQARSRSKDPIFIY